MALSIAEHIRTFQFFRAGQHRTAAGEALHFSEADLEQIHLAYSQGDRAPLVIGHPPDDGPAYGEVQEVFRKGATLYAVARCSQALIDLVKSGAYKHVSAAFFRSPWGLRHIGFLGAMPPAVKGLPPLQFAEHSASPGTVCFSGGLSVGPEFAISSDYVPPAGWGVDPESLRFYQAARGVQAGCPDLSFIEAASIVQRLRS